MSILMMFVVLLFVILIGMPIAFALLLSSTAFVALQGTDPVMLVAQRFFVSNDSFPLMAIPFFMLAGEIMSESGVSRRLVNVASVCVGWITGGLVMVVTLTGMFFAAMSGSSAACTAATGSILIPAMKEKGYKPEFTAAAVAAAGVVGIVIPPSITMVVFGVATQTSVTQLFTAGIIPGIIMGLSMMVVNYFLSKKHGYVGEPLKSAKETWAILKEGIWALMTPVIILGGIYRGIFTATESAVVAVVYVLIVGFFVYRELEIKKLPTIMLKTITGSAVVLIIMNAAGLFGWILTANQVPQKVAIAIAEYTTNRYLIITLVNLMLLVVGCFINASPAVIMLAPIITPVLVGLGYDPVFIGVLIVINLSIGCITPPVGVDLFVAQSISGVSIGRITVAILPLMGILLLDLIIFTFFPQIILFLPSLM